ncbi:MAG TPA: hypothetical protein VI076_01040 [Actinopolymorphaceae bacterium]
MPVLPVRPRPRGSRWGATLVAFAAAGSLLLAAGPSTASTEASRDPFRTTVRETDHRPACAEPSDATATAGCLLAIATDAKGAPLGRAAAKAAALEPYTAADLQDAYRLPSDLLGARQTIAVVVPYDNPRVEEDLAVYREANDLPACTEQFPCLRKIDQRGGTELPPANPTWSLSASGGVQMASAVCPNCHLLLVEADDASLANLGIAVEQAAAQGADVIVAMFGGYEDEETLARASSYDHEGIPIVAPSGTDGFPNQVGRQLLPAAYSTVIAVGGTTLYRDDNARGWTETAWAGSGSGCSAYVPRPSWQPKGLCGDKRTVADTAAVASPNTPVALYDTYAYRGWLAVSGTPLSAAIIGGVHALAGNAGTGDAGRRLYQNRKHLFDVTSGSTGSCGGSYLCTAIEGYDGPTGNGSPHGIGAF